MTAPAEVRERRDRLRDDLDAARERETELADQAAEARADGEDEGADGLLDDLRDTRARRENLAAALPRLDARVRVAERIDLERRAVDLAAELPVEIEAAADEARTRLDSGTAALARALDELEAGLDAADRVVDLRAGAARLAAIFDGVTASRSAPAIDLPGVGLLRDAAGLLLELAGRPRDLAVWLESKYQNWQHSPSRIDRVETLVEERAELAGAEA